MLLNQYINGHDDDVALKCKDGSMTYRALLSAVENLASWITNHNAERVGIAFDNSFAWVIADLACQQANVCCIPVPLFFTASQQEHVLNESQCHFLLTNRGGELSEWSESPTVIDNEHDIVAHPLKHDSRVYTPVGTNKITFTSGSTGSPKGVCLSTESQWKVAHSNVRAFFIKRLGYCLTNTASCTCKKYHLITPLNIHCIYLNVLAIYLGDKHQR